MKKNKKTKKSKGSPLRILVSIIAVITIILFISAFTRIGNYSSRAWYNYSTDDYLRSAENSRFDDLYDTTVRDMKKNADYSQETIALRNLAFYLEYSILKGAYEGAGEVEKSKSFDAKLQEYKSGTGEFSFMTDKIDEGLKE